MDKELLPCPFCGNGAFIIEKHKRFSISCGWCACRYDRESQHKESVIQLWNTRNHPKEV